jgi:hypothetical protein
MLTLLRVLALVGSWNAVLGGGYEPDRAVSVAANAGTRLEINRVSAEDLDSTFSTTCSMIDLS